MRWICDGGQRHAIEQRGLRHRVVAVGVIGRHDALVAERHVDARPVDRRRAGLGELLVDRARRAPAGERDPAGAARGDRLADAATEVAGGGGRQRGGIRGDDDASLDTRRLLAHGVRHSRPSRASSVCADGGPHDDAGYGSTPSGVFAQASSSGATTSHPVSTMSARWKSDGSPVITS